MFAELPERSYGADCRLYVPDHPTNRFKNLYVWYLLNLNNSLPLYFLLKQSCLYHRHSLCIINLKAYYAFGLQFFQDTIFDEFFLAHIFGWWGKAILIRNQPLLWVLSIGFELLEVGLFCLPSLMCFLVLI